ncbi:MAG TPA: hypothetical protein VNJ05_07105 [Sphingomicrobium sp.]|nr:hypothetical protein [Sphingomicrobium sp.]
MIVTNIAEAAVSMAEAQAYARVETGEEEALLAGLVRTASALCESFTGLVLVARPFEEVLSPSGQWQRLGLTPVRTIEEVAVLVADGSATLLSVGEYEMDIDSRGDGWVRVQSGGDKKIRLRGQAGMAVDPNGVPEPLRQGILRLIAHLFTTRDGTSGEPPAAVTALWRPYRRMRLA